MTTTPRKLVEDGVTVVTINYRLGALGFLAHPALADANGQSGDYGLMDQQAALRWVQRNIASFGGNPHNVTIFGESAGGLSTLSQVASPQARGLFERAIVESGSYNLTQASLSSAEAAGEAFAANAGCASQTAACLRSLPVSAILANENTAGYTPNINSEVLPETLETAFATGNFNRVPIINGTNRDEWRLFVALSELEGNPVTASNYQSMISSTLGVPAAVAAVIAAKYPLSAFPSPSIALGAVGTDAIFACPALTIDQSVSHFVPTFAYEFNDENAPENFLPPVSFPYGAAHASEIQYLMDLPTAAFPGTLSAQQQQLATIMKGYWTNFAKRGFPSSSGTPFWPLFNNLTQKMQSLVPPTPQTETDFATTHNCAFWTALEAANHKHVTRRVSRHSVTAGANIQRSFKNERYLPGMDEFRARRVVDALRDRGVNAHLLRGGSASSACACRCPAAAKPSGTPTVRPASKPRSCATACSSATCPRSKAPRTFNESQVVEAIARTDYDQPVARQRTVAPPPGPALTREGGVFRRFLDGFRYR